MVYINYRYNGQTETVDEFKDRKEAKEMLSEYRLAYGPGSELWLSSRATKDWRESKIDSLPLKDQLIKRFGLRKSMFSNHCSDLYVLIEDKEKEQVVFDWIKNEKKLCVYRSHSDVVDQSWFGKTFLEIPFQA